MDSQLMRSRDSKPLDTQGNRTGGFEDEVSGDPEEPSGCYERDEWLLKFEVNDRGVGQILLPPRLSIFLQSDRICITPMGGGLFVKSA